LTYSKDGDLPTLSAAQKEILIRDASAVRDLPEVKIQTTVLSA
jgi:hypothetical protein